MRILLVEDDDMIGESVMAGLETEGHAIATQHFSHSIQRRTLSSSSI